jgi:hypothetical protein
LTSLPPIRPRENSKTPVTKAAAAQRAMDARLSFGAIASQPVGDHQPAEILERGHHHQTGEPGDRQ